MALVLADRVKETTTTTGTGAITLAGAATGYQAFSVIGDGNTTYYCIAGQGTSEWEVGYGTYTSAGNTLSRDVVFGSSNSGAAVNFSAGTKDVFLTAPSGVIGLSSILQNSKSAAYTLVLSDAGKHLLHPSADTTARTFTIPANASVAYPIGTAITFVNQNGAGALTIAITTDTMRLAGAGTTGSRTLAANGVATALKVTATEWIISGTGLT